MVTAQLDDPYCLDAMDRWLANWQLRCARAANGYTATGAAPGTASAPETLRAFGIREHDGPNALARTSVRCGGTGPATLLLSSSTPARWSCWAVPLAHPFQPLLNPPGCVSSPFARASPTPAAFAHTPSGIWAPVRLRAPGMEHDYAAAGVGHCWSTDRPAATPRSADRSATPAWWRSAQDLQVSFPGRVAQVPYPGNPAYRDFHTYDHLTGLEAARVTGHNVDSDAKAL